MDGDDFRPSAAPTALDRAVDPVRRAFRGAGLILMAVMILLPVTQVILREGLRSPFIGAEELARFMLICVVFITLPYVVASGASIRMEELVDVFPRSIRRGLRVIMTATAAIGFGVAAFSVAVATLRNLNNATPTLGIPYWVFFSAAFLGLFLASIESVIQFAKALRGQDLYVTFAGEQPPDEVDLEHALGPSRAEPRG
jgi:TRAP-type C4-dicarboxylate transport system permease small subunit